MKISQQNNKQTMSSIISYYYNMLNLSFSGCGFLGIYHIGVVSAFREHAPEILQNQVSGCSAGALVAACIVCDCCLGQMVGDVLEIALKARSHALGPLHPSFNIVDILRNGLRRILPIDAHKICSGRVFISLTRWKDGKNLLVSQFDTREELIQALICSSFVPMYSGFVPPKFKGVYYWDGGLSNNNPILNADTIIVSPFGGESDICPREESSSFFLVDFQGTNIQWSDENFYRISKALFPPSPEILKAICFRGYKDAVSFLKSRNLLHCSCYKHFREKTSISSVFGDDIRNIVGSCVGGIDDDDEKQLVKAVAAATGDGDNDDNDSIYDSDEELIIQYAHTNESLVYQEMPSSVCEVLDAACDDEKGIINYVYHSKISRAISIMLLPWTLPFEFSLGFTKKLLELVPKIQVPTDSTNLINSILLYLNFIIEKLTHDKYQYHTRVSCKLCLLSSSSANHCHHNHASLKAAALPSFNDDAAALHNSSSSNSRLMLAYYPPKFCPKHRVPSVCGSDTASLYKNRRATGTSRRHSRSYASTNYTTTGSEIESTVDKHEYKSSPRTYSFYRKKYHSAAHLKRQTTKSKNRALPITDNNNPTIITTNNAPFTYTRTFNHHPLHEEDSQANFTTTTTTTTTPNKHEIVSEMNSSKMFNNNASSSATPIPSSTRVRFHLSSEDVCTTPPNLMVIDTTSNNNNSETIPPTTPIDTIVVVDNNKLLNSSSSSSSLLMKTTNLTDAEKLSTHQLPAIISRSSSNGQLKAPIIHDSFHNIRTNNKNNNNNNHHQHHHHHHNSSSDDDEKKKEVKKSSPAGQQSEPKSKQISWDNYWDSLENVALGNSSNIK